MVRIVHSQCTLLQCITWYTEVHQEGQIHTIAARKGCMPDVNECEASL
jgi:hypothetical protein